MVGAQGLISDLCYVFDGFGVYLVRAYHSSQTLRSVEHFFRFISLEAYNRKAYSTAEIQSTLPQKH